MNEQPKWPQRIINDLGREPQIGDWYAEYGIEDLRQVTAADLADILTRHDERDSDWDFGKFWIDEGPARLYLDVPILEGKDTVAGSGPEGVQGAVVLREGPDVEGEPALRPGTLIQWAK